MSVDMPFIVLSRCTLSFPSAAVFASQGGTFLRLAFVACHRRVRNKIGSQISLPL
jgi:hypothetical protein